MQKLLPEGALFPPTSAQCAIELLQEPKFHRRVEIARLGLLVMVVEGKDGKTLLGGRPYSRDGAAGEYRYRVVSTQVVSPEDVAVLESTGDEILTLLTCHPFYFVGAAPNRFIVRAQRVGG